MIRVLPEEPFLFSGLQPPKSLWNHFSRPAKRSSIQPAAFRRYHITVKVQRGLMSECCMSFCCTVIAVPTASSHERKVCRKLCVPHLPKPAAFVASCSSPVSRVGIRQRPELTLVTTGAARGWKSRHDFVALCAQVRDAALQDLSNRPISILAPFSHWTEFESPDCRRNHSHVAGKIGKDFVNGRQPVTRVSVVHTELPTSPCMDSFRPADNSSPISAPGLRIGHSGVRKHAAT